MQLPDWTPVENPPEKIGQYLVTIGHPSWPKNEIRICYYDSQRFVVSALVTCPYVLAWTYLPTPSERRPI